MEDNYKNILSETSFVLKHLDKNLYNKIPANIIETIEKNKNHNYTVSYDFTKPLCNQKLNEKTFDLLSILYLKYCAEKDERNNIFKICLENNTKEELLLRQKFDSTTLFNTKKNNIKEKNNESNISFNQNNQSNNTKIKNLINKIKKMVKQIFNKR